MKYRVMGIIVWLILFGVIAYFASNESNKKDDYIKLDKSLWICVDSRNETILINGRVQASTKCISYTRMSK